MGVLLDLFKSVGSRSHADSWVIVVVFHKVNLTWTQVVDHVYTSCPSFVPFDLLSCCVLHKAKVKTGDTLRSPWLIAIPYFLKKH